MIHRASYYIRHGYGLTAIRNGREAKALVEFCREQLLDQVEHNIVYSHRHFVYKMTIEMYHDMIDGELHPLRICNCPDCKKIVGKKFYRARYSNFFEYVDAHVSYYWS